MMQADSPVSLAKVDATKEKKVDTFNIAVFSVFNGEQVNRFPRWRRGSKLRGFQRWSFSTTVSHRNTPGQGQTPNLQHSPKNYATIIFGQHRLFIRCDSISLYLSLSVSEWVGQCVSDSFRIRRSLAIASTNLASFLHMVSYKMTGRQWGLLSGWPRRVVHSGPRSTPR